ncbi:hypothetical protein EIC00_24555 [Vibrio parahaemolyticus]|nr:hypothetical protein [Vibrio parahaemolyticus]EGR3234346.1 hypothetical protein [Vibrio parahaemolyticus]
MCLVSISFILSKVKKYVYKSTYITKRLRGILNAWHFWFESALVFTAQWVRLGGWRCSPLNAAL